MTTILVKECGKCPFIEWNDRISDGAFCSHPGLPVWSDTSEGTPPSWCPLRIESLTIEFKDRPDTVDAELTQLAVDAMAPTRPNPLSPAEDSKTAAIIDSITPGPQHDVGNEETVEVDAKEAWELVGQYTDERRAMLHEMFPAGPPGPLNLGPSDAEILRAHDRWLLYKLADLELKAEGPT